jgi:type IV pilus assembly protein PilY1
MLNFLAHPAGSMLRPVALCIAAGAAFGSAALQAAEPAQVPLTSRVAEPPTPNVMVTIDDSGSMLADFMPEGTFTLPSHPNRNITLANAWVGAFPGDVRKLGGVAPPTGNYLDGVVTSLRNGESVYQKQYRSPDVNAIYYNPDLLYLPWQKPDGSGRMPNSPPAAAPWDPVPSLSGGATFNLTVNSNATYTRWYTAPNSSSFGNRAFYPGLVYRLTAGADPGLSGSYTRYDLNANDGSHAAATKHANRTDCAAAKCTKAEEQQNFANWFTYYRMRESLTKAAVSDSLTSFKDKLRVGWGRINKTDAERIDGVNFRIIENAGNGGPLRNFDGARMETVLEGVQKISSWPSTPLRNALNEMGRYFDLSQRAAVGSPWLEDPTNTNSEKLACRRSVNLLMTDGYYNDNYSGAGDVDAVNGPNYAGAQNPNNYSPTQYVAERPFIDGPPTVANTLADVASKYYVKDLDGSIDNKVWPITGDIAYWQHLTQFMVGLGVKGTLDSSSEAAKSDTLAKIKAGTLKWPDPNSGSPQKIDDMWHAAVNTGGDFYSVANVTELTAALSEAFGKAAGNEAKEAGVATASSTIIAENVKYVPKYKSVSWYGDVEAFELDANGLQGVMLWNASAALPAHGSRSLYTWDPSRGARGEPVEFTWANMGGGNQSLVGSVDLANYIRGDASKEGSGKAFRSRDGKYLGDFVNSPPVVVRGRLDLGYAAFDASYSDFVARKKARSEAAIVVGGNAGVVHIFRSSDGREVYGHLPREGLSSLRQIAAKDYGTNENFHRFFVDGPMNETDAKIATRRNSSPEWANLVIGSMGAGGKAFFAMHLPTDFGDGLDASDLGGNTLLWEKSGASDGDIGYMFADFAVGKIKGGGWKAFVGNGVYSSNGNAVLLVVDMATGDIEKRLTVATTGDTGLMGVSLVKDVETQEVVGAYAGDLKGNVWRFDFEGGGDASWKIGFGGNPLFTATDPSGGVQPITVPPVFVNHPKQGRVVLFGTGRLIDEGDSVSDQRQTYYGVWDPVKVGEFSSALDSPFETVTPDRSRLVVHTINQEPKTDIAGTFYEVITQEVNWDVDLGWLVDLPWDRQRVIYPSMILSGDYVYFSTVVPAAPAERCDPTTGVGYNFLLMAASGGVPTVPILDTNGDGIVDGDDQIVAGFLSPSDGRDAIVVGEDGLTHLCNTADQCKTFVPPKDPEEPPPAGEVKDRVWKQILTPPTPAD